ncbi:MAG: hypothetical protein AAF672_01595 [Pseudomonadota bacterium]
MLSITEFAVIGALFMGLSLVIIAAIPAYLAAGIALFLGASWLMALGVLMAIGVSGTLILATVRVIVQAAPSKAPHLSTP